MVKKLLIFGFALLGIGCNYNGKKSNTAENIKVVPSTGPFIRFVADPYKDSIGIFWKDEKGSILGSLTNTEQYFKQQGKKLRFAMNGGMYLQDQSPQGLYIYKGKTIKAIDTNRGSGNFYLAPNGIFYITQKGNAEVCTTQQFPMDIKMRYATQSGPMLVINGNIHPKFSPTSQSFYIRNGVGILPNGKVLFAMSRIPVNLYCFAEFFKKQGCKNALYLDGYVSRTYLPEQQFIQRDGSFGVIIAVWE